MTNHAEAFPFVNLSEPKEGKNEDLRRLVRSNAMRSYRQKQKQKAENPSTPEAPYILQPSINDHPHLLTVAYGPLGTSGRSLSEQGYHKGAVNPQSESLNAPALAYSTLVCAHREGIDDQEPGRAISRIRSIPRTKLLLNLGNLSGGGLDDPFDAYPIRGDPSHNSRLLNHCKC